MTQINVLVADDHEVVRDGLVELFHGSRIRVVAQAADGDDAVAKARQFHPDVVVMDIRMPDSDGLSALEQIHREMSETRVVMLSVYDNPTYIARSAALGAVDYLLKGATRQEIIAAVERAASRHVASTGSVLSGVKGALTGSGEESGVKVPLTQRELQVLRHLAHGLSNRDIAHSLGISVETVKEHVQHVLRKIDVDDRTRAAVWAVRNGLV